MPKPFTRLDKLLVDRGFTPSRQRAQALILAAKVSVEGELITKAGQVVPNDSNIAILGTDNPYVSRGGLKLEHAIKTFELKVAGLVAIDVGASTGGFTDCLLQHGVQKVYAVDVGYGQLAWKIRQDPRTVVLERQNIRLLPPSKIPEPIQLATIDTSFISLKLVLPPVLPFLASAALVIALIKPQFEAGREKVGKGGVVKDPAVHRQVCNEILAFSQELGFHVIGITPSPILGPKGNREFLLAATVKEDGLHGE